MSRIQEIFITPLTATMHVKAGDPIVLFDDLERTLAEFSNDTLSTAAEQIRTRRPLDGYYRDPLTFPSTAECVEWCSRIMPSKEKTRDTSAQEYDRRAYIADEKIQTTLGRLAAREGWLMGLWDFYHETNGDEPSETKIHELRRKAITNDQLDIDCDDPDKHEAFRVISRSMRAKRNEKIAVAMQGEPVE